MCLSLTKTIDRPRQSYQLFCLLSILTTHSTSLNSFSIFLSQSLQYLLHSKFVSLNDLTLVVAGFVFFAVSFPVVWNEKVNVEP